MKKREAHLKGQSEFECFVHASRFVYITSTDFCVPQVKINPRDGRLRARGTKKLGSCCHMISPNQS